VSPRGQRGGLPGTPNKLSIAQQPGEFRDCGKGTGIKLAKGTQIVTDAGGGGGYGPPSERDPAAVRNDLREGYITEAHARTHYPQAF
jgi:N-methylhydantoinase B